MGARPIALSAEDLLARYRAVRGLTTALAHPLSDADATLQSMEDASPAKWHLAHTSWFFETFILRDHTTDYSAFDDDYAFLFNSYYEAEGPRHARGQRGLISRPSLDQLLAYRSHVDAAIEVAAGSLNETALGLLELGLHHEQQHQELLLTDIKHLFAQNPLLPVYMPADAVAPPDTALEILWIKGPAGIHPIGHGGAGFAFDCETPRHDALLAPFALASRTVTNGEWIEFIEDGGYAGAQYWLSDGWAWVQGEAIDAPLYWQKDDSGWQRFGLDGLQPVILAEPVTHISLYEADAFASWADAKWSGARLPTEAEWEVMAAALQADGGNQLSKAAAIRPTVSSMPANAGGLSDMFGNVWEWTGSAYRPYPGFRAARGAVGEYNGKFMSGQFVLKGGSCATPRGHMRASYRNFFYPHQRWQFTGLRLARDI
ncbi:MAG: ergothioneine biosynthesis protein EgtB [Sphingorhabdus sp.]